MCQDYLKSLINNTDVVWSNNVSQDIKDACRDVFSNILNKQGVVLQHEEDPAHHFISWNLQRIASESPNVGVPVLQSVLQELNNQGKRLQIKIFNDDNTKHSTSWSSSDNHPFNIKINLTQFATGNDRRTGNLNFLHKDYNVTGRKTINGKEVYHVREEYDPFHITLFHELGHINDWLATGKDRKTYLEKKNDLGESLQKAKKEKYPILKDFVLYPTHWKNIGELRNIVGADGDSAKTPQIYSENAFRADAGYNIRASHARPEKGGFFITEENAYDLVPTHVLHKVNFHHLPNNGNLTINDFNTSNAPHAMAFTPTKILREFGDHTVYKAKTGHLPQLQDKFAFIKEITRKYGDVYQRAKEEFHRNDAQNKTIFAQEIINQRLQAIPSFSPKKQQEVNNKVSAVYDKNSTDIVSQNIIDRIKERKRMEKFNIFLKNMENMFG